jgi:hypothetical protein
MKILYWAQLSYNNNTFMPVFFFNPDFNMKMYTNQFGFLDVPIYINGTNGLYDGYHYATINKATNLGGCPPDFCKEPLIFSATLNNVSFTIYPLDNGQIFLANQQIFDTSTSSQNKTITSSAQTDEIPSESIKENFEHSIDDLKEKPIIKENFSSDNFSNSYILIICFFLLLIIIIIICFYGYLKK